MITTIIAWAPVIGCSLAVYWTLCFACGFWQGFCEGVVREIALETVAAIRRVR